MTKYIRDYYKILRIKRNANQKTIKRAYKRALLKYDSGKGNVKNAEKKLKLIKEAYKVLSDENKRAKYDELYEQASNNKKNNNSNLNDTFKTVKDVHENYDLVSKGLNTIFKSIKSQPLLTGSKILIGGAAAGYGYKRGKNIINKRKGKIIN